MKGRRLRLIFIIALFYVIIGLFFIQIVKNKFYLDLSQHNRIRITAIESSRGVIYDRNNIPIVSNRLSFDLAIIPQGVSDLDTIFKAISDVLGTPQKDLHKRYKKNFIAPFAPAYIARDISKDKAFLLEEAKLNMPGVVIQTRPVRDYIYKEATAHLAGYIGEISDEELEGLRIYGYRIKDYVGRTGLEKTFNTYLRGENGGMQIEVNNLGYQTKIIGYKRPISGKDLYLTIDIRLQNFIYDLIKDKKAAVVVIDPANGEVLALVSSPSFDPNIFSTPNRSTAKINSILNSKDKILLNRALQAYTPGSIFKVISSTSFLETQTIDLDTYFLCTGSYGMGKQPFNCWFKQGHGQQNLIEALTHSCNIFFYKSAKRTGPDALSNFALNFGLGRPTGIDLPAEAKGLVPSRHWKKSYLHQNWFGGDTLNFCLGQGFLLMTPIQACCMISVIANGGYAIMPFLVKKIDSVEIANTKLRRIPISQSTIGILKDGLREVVDSPSGTGHGAKIADIAVAGKTGTAQVGDKNSHAWFVGFAPVNNPKISFTVFIEHGGSGGGEPTRIAKSILEKLKKEGYI